MAKVTAVAAAAKQRAQYRSVVIEKKPDNVSDLKKEQPTLKKIVATATTEKRSASTKAAEPTKSLVVASKAHKESTGGAANSQGCLDIADLQNLVKVAAIRAKRNGSDPRK